MEQEVRFVHREETFNDLAVRELAKTQARCMCLLQYKRCSKKDCAKCNSNKYLLNCKEMMSDYDRSRLDNYTIEYYGAFSRSPLSWMGHKQFTRTYNRFVLLLIVVFWLIVLLLGLGSGVGPFDRAHPQLDYDAMIIRTMQKAQANIRDLDKDGKINCVDYAIMFKLTWDREYPVLKDKCEIVRNVNKRTEMNHLFTYVNGIGVEAWAPDPYRFRMEDNWGGRYDSSLNIYGETAYWVSEVR